MEMNEIIAHLPEIIYTCIGGGFIYMVKRYLKSQDERYTMLANKFNKFSDSLINKLNELLVMQAGDKEKHSNTENHLKVINKDIESLYDRSNRVNEKVAKMEVKLLKK